MDEILKMYAMSGGDPTGEPLELDPNLEDDFAADEVCSPPPTTMSRLSMKSSS